MALGQRAALLTVCIVAASASAAAVLVIDAIPDAGQGPRVAVRPAQPAIEAPSTPRSAPLETGSLPREQLYPEGALPSRETEPPPLRFSFIAPEALLHDDTLASVDPATPKQIEAWSTHTQTRTAKPASTPRQSSAIASVRSAREPSHKRWFSRSLKKRLAEISPAASERIAEKFRSAKVAWPPTDIALVAIKDQKHLELHARADGGKWTFVHSYPVLAASGRTGPKLLRGDKQVPEGVYRISFLNPNSRYHVSMRVNYPNSFDRKMARKDGRKDLGGDIMIHGKRSSAGCLAMGDAAAEELFVLAAEVGLRNLKLVIAPTDFRKNGIPSIRQDQPAWLSKLYIEVAAEMAQFKAPAPSGGGSLLTLLGL